MLYIKFYDDKATLTDEQKQLYQRSILVYDEIAPTYHIALKEDKPVLVWDFYSLSNVIRLKPDDDKEESVLK